MSLVKLKQIDQSGASADQIIIWNGTNWVPASPGTPGNIGTANSEGTADTWARSDHTHKGLNREAGDFSAGGITEKTTLADDDRVLIEDSAAANAKKYATIDNMRPVFGTQYQYAESLTESSITGVTDWQEKLTINVPSSIPAGDYFIQWSFTWTLDDEGKQALYRVQTDDTTTIGYHEVTPKKKEDKDTRYPASGFAEVTFTAAAHTIDLDFATEDDGKTAYIYDARLVIWRVA